MKERRGQTLVGLLAVIAIVAILAAVYFGGGLGPENAVPNRPDNEGQTTIGRSVARARDEVCRGQLRQLRGVIEAGSDETPPQSLDDLQGISPESKKCPIGGEAYQYDAGLQRVTCPHPGHENY